MKHSINVSPSHPCSDRRFFNQPILLTFCMMLAMCAQVFAAPEVIVTTFPNDIFLGESTPIEFEVQDTGVLQTADQTTTITISYTGELTATQTLGTINVDSESKIITIIVQNGTAAISLTPTLQGNVDLTITADITYSGGNASFNVGSNLENGLIAHYSFEGDVSDQTANAFDGAPTGITYIQGIMGQAADFDHLDFVDISSSVNNFPSGNDPRTVAFWSKPDRLVGHYQNALSWGTNNTNNRFTVRLDNDGRLGVIGAFNDHFSSHILTEGVWQHIAVTFDSTALHFYVDGVFIDSKTTTLNTDNSGMLRLGVSVSGVDSEWYDGALDEMRIYDRALDASEITQVYDEEFTIPLSIVYVNTFSSGNNDGSSWADAYTSIHDAFTGLTSNTAIWVVGGDYAVGPARSDNLSIENLDNIVVMGGFNGTETSPEERNVLDNPTVISGDVGVTDDITDNTYRIMVLTNSSNVFIDNLIFEHANANGAAGIEDRGGAIFIDNTVTYIYQTIFRHNFASANGGAIHSLNSPASPSLIEACLFENNTSDTFGGAIYAGTSLSISNSIFHNNQSGGSYDGGALYTANGATLALNASTLYGNSAGSKGGGLYSAGTSTVSNSIFWNNTATLEPGVYKDPSGTVSISSSIVEATGGSSSWDSTSGSDAGNNLDEDPLFLNESMPAGSDNIWFTVDDGLQLTESSPAVDVGDNANKPEEDALGKERDDEIVDMGAYELQNTSAVGPNLIGDTSFTPPTQLTTSQGLTPILIWNMDTMSTGYNGNIQSITFDVLGADPSVEFTGALIYDLTSNGMVSNTPTFSSNSISFTGLSWPINSSANTQLEIKVTTGSGFSADNIQINLEKDNIVLEDAVPVGGMSIFSGPIALIIPYTPSILYVKPLAQGTGDGSSWANAANLHGAIAYANPTDEIWMSTGTYTPNDVDREVDTIDMNVEGVAYYGGFSGNGTETSLEERDWVMYPTILSGDIGSSGINTDNSMTVALISAANIVIDGLIIQDGYADGVGLAKGNGAGIYASSSATDLVIRNTIIRHNIVTYLNGSGGAFIQSTSYGAANHKTTFENCVFENNSAGYAGAIQSKWELDLIKCIFVDNQASHSSPAAVIYNSGSPGGEISHCVFYNNIGSDNNGQAIYNTGGSNLQLRNSILWSNVGTIPNEVEASGMVNTSFSIVSGSDFGIDQGNNLDLDPIFLDPANPAGIDGIWFTQDDGLRLQLGSPAIDAGISITGLNHDILEQPYVNTPDLGAYEGGVTPQSQQVGPLIFTYQVPENNEVDVAIDTDLTLTFEEVIDLATGNIELYQDGGLVEIFDETSSEITTVDEDLIITLSSALLPSSTYHVLISNGMVMGNVSGNAFGGFMADHEWTFTTLSPVQAPNPLVLLQQYPDHEESNVPLDASLTLTFAEDIVLVSGVIEIFTGPILRESFNFPSNSLSVSGNQLTITPPAGLANNSSHTVTVQANLIVGAETGDEFGQFSSTNEWVFYTIDSYENTSEEGGQHQRLAAGRDTIYVLNDVTVLSAGRNERDQLGQTSSANLFDIETVPAQENLISIDAGEHHFIGLTDGGTIVTWGSNEYGQSKGVGSIEVDSSLDYVIQVCAGAFSSYAINNLGELWVKGKNNMGQLGLGNTTDRTIWTQVTLPSGNISKVSAGIEHMLILMDDGRVYGAGSNGYGQLAQSETINFPNFVPVLNTTEWTDIEAGGFHTFTISDNLDLYAGGKNTHGQLGLGFMSTMVNPPQMAASNIVDVSAGYDHSVVLQSSVSSGILMGAGSNAFGQIAQGDPSDVPNFNIISNNISVDEIEAGPYSSLMKDSDGIILKWGQSPDGESLFVPIFHFELDPIEEVEILLPPPMPEEPPEA